MSEGMLPPLVLELRAKAGELITEVRRAAAETEKAAATSVAAGKKMEGAAAGTAASTEKAVATGGGGWSKFMGISKASAIGVAGAAAVIGVASLKMAGDFQAQTTRLETAAGESHANLKMVGDGILNVARSTGTSTEQLSAGMYMIESSSYHGAEGLKVLQAAAQGAKNEGADLEGVSNALTTVMTDLGHHGKDAANDMSQMVAAVGQGKMKMDDLAGSIHSVLPNAAALGIKFPEVAGALATMTAEGVSADQAAQNLNHTIVKLAAPTTAMTNAMAAYGVSSSDLKNNLGKNGLSGTMEILQKAILQHMGPGGLALMNTFNQSKVAAADAKKMLDNLPPSIQSMAKGFLAGTVGQKEFAKAGKEMGAAGSSQVASFIKMAQSSKGFSDALKSGKDDAQTFNQAMYSMLGDQTGLQVALHLTGDHMQTFKDNVKIIGKASADANGNVKDWAVTQGTFNVRMSQLKETVQTAAIAIGQKLLPPVSAFVGFLASHQGVVIAFAAVIGTLLVAAAAAWTAQLVKTAAGNVAEFAKMIASGAKWLWSQSMQLVDAASRWAVYLAQWVARQAISLGQSAALWGMYAAEWIAKQAAAVWEMVTTQGAALATWVAEQASSLAGSAALWLWYTAARVAGYVVTAAAATAAFIAENAATLGIIAVIGLLVAAAVWVATHWSTVWHGIGVAVSWVHDNVIAPVIGGIKAYINGLVSVIQWYAGIWKGIWDGIGSALQWVYDHTIGPIIGTIQGAISKVSGAISGIGGAASSVGHFLGFDNGGVVPGPAGAPMLAVVHGQEVVLSRDMLAGKQAPPKEILGAAKSAHGYTPAASGPDMSQTALAGGGGSSSNSSGGGPTVIVNVHTSASSRQIAAEAGWELRKLA